MKFYKDHYDVVIIGGALAGLSAALQLQAFGVKDILILEKHNLPGGLATSFVRDGFEIEATLHEMMSIGPKEDRLKVGQFFDEMGVQIDWLRVPEAYRFVEPKKNIDITLHAGFRTMADEIGVRQSLVLDRLDRIAAKIVPAAHSLSDEMASEWPSGIYSEISAIIKAHVAAIAS